jgi:2-iminobutanoate/2-iminopropanoate deaminase
MSKRYIVEVEGVPPSPSPISNAVVVGNQCWISGQLSVGDDGSYVPGTAREEASRAFAHVFRIVEAAGFKRSDIVYVDLAFIRRSPLPTMVCSRRGTSFHWVRRI